MVKLSISVSTFPDYSVSIFLIQLTNAPFFAKYQGFSLFFVFYPFTGE